MRLSIFLLLFGERRLRVERESCAAVLDLCLQDSLSLRFPQWEEDGGLCFSCSLRTAKRLLRLCHARGLAIEDLGSQGLPMLFLRLLGRPGALVGALLALALILLSQSFLWDIRVRGNERMTTAEVLSELRACGLFTGTYLPGLDVPALENRVLIASDGIAWISVNLSGTVAEVQVVEGIQRPPKEPTAPANLVASADGQIELLQVYRGQSVVKVGQAVRRGELLISGIYDSSLEGYRLTRAAGEVLARTERHIHVEIPLSYEQKLYAEGECREIVLNFFDFSLKIFKKAGNWEGSCDIIEREIGSASLGTSVLPVHLLVTESLPYRMQTAVRTPEEASALAFAQLEHELAALSREAELLEKRITVSVTDTAVLLDCTLRCIENIAVQAELEVDG